MNDPGHPLSVFCRGGNHVWNSEQEIPELQSITYDYGRFTVTCDSGNAVSYTHLDVYKRQGVLSPQEDFINAAVETNADAILVSSLYGQGELDCRGLREKCDEAGLKGIKLYVGGNIVVGKQNFDEVKVRFEKMGFDRVYPPGTSIDTTLRDLKEDFPD